MTLVPWPVDAVMIVASLEGEFRHDQIRGFPVACRCRKCEANLLADSWTIARAENLPETRGRPVLFFCIKCAALHDLSMLNVMEDHRGGQFIRMKR